MVEVLWARPHYKTLLSALLLAKCLRAKLWEGSYDISYTLTVSVPGMVEVLWARPHYKTLLSALLLAKCLRAKLWEGSRHVSRQLTGIG